ncbi:MAG: HEAT repeat domain-containing protein, partial [Thermoguttaceae bacterium]
SNLEFSPDGKQLATGGGAGIVKLWDVATGKVSMTLDLQNAELVRSIAFSPDGKTVAAASASSATLNGSIRLWDADTGTVRGLPETMPMYAIAFSPDGQTLAAAGSGLKLWDVVTRRARMTLRATSRADCLAFSPNGKTLAVAPASYHDGREIAELWDITTGRLRARLAGNSPRSPGSIAFSPDGMTLAIATGGPVCLWDLSALPQGTGETVIEVWEDNPDIEVLGSLVARVKVTAWGSAVNSVAFSPNGKRLISDGERLISGAWGTAVRVWDVTSGRQLTTLTADSTVLSSVSSAGFDCTVAHSPDGKRFAAAIRDTIQVWNAEDAAEQRPSSPENLPKTESADSGPARCERFALGTNMMPLTCVAFSPDGKTLAGGTQEVDKNGAPVTGIVILWDVGTGQERTKLRYPGRLIGEAGGETGGPNHVSMLAFSPDSRTLATITSRGAKLWDANNGQELANVPGYGHGVSPSWLEFSPDGKSLGTTQAVWDVTTWQERFKLGTSDRGCIAFSPDGKTLTAVWANSLHLFDAATGQEQFKTDAGSSLYGVAYSPDGQTIAAAGDGGAILWDVTGGDAPVTLRKRVTLRSSWGRIDRVACAPDSRMVATASSMRNVKLWDIRTGQQLALLRDALAFAFSPDGKVLATGEIKPVSESVSLHVTMSEITELVKPDLLAAQAKSAASEFITAMKASDEKVAGPALDAIGAQKEAVPVLIEALKDSSREVGDAVRLALRSIGPNAVEPLTVTLRDADPSVRFRAALSLGHLGRVGSEVEAALNNALKDEDEMVRKAVAWALTQMRNRPKTGNSDGDHTP